MKILIFSTAYYPMVGGAEVAIKQITDRLPDVEFDLITARMQRGLSRTEMIGRCRVHRIGFGFSGDKFLLPVWGVCVALALNYKKQYNGIWSMMASQAGIAASFFKYVLRLFNKRMPMVLTVQEGDTEEYLKRYVGGNELLYKVFIHPLYRLVFVSADYITAISKDLKTRAQKNNATVSVSIIPNGVDVEKYKSAVAIEKKAEEKVIITTSRLVAKNGIEDLIKSMTHLPSDVRLWILGVGPEEQKLRDLAKDLHISERVIFFGFIAEENIPAHLKAADVFVRPSLSEGLGNSFLEAMAAGLPVVGTPVGGIPDFLKNGVTGWFCEVQNPQSIAEKIKYILDVANAEAVASVRENAAQLIAASFDWRIIAGSMGQIFEKVFITDIHKKIVIATGTFPPEVSGQATYVGRFFDQLQSRKEEIDTVVVTYGSEAQRAGIRVVSRSVWRHVAYWWQVRQEARYDAIIYAQDLFSSGLPAAVAKRRNNTLAIRLGGDFLWEKMVNSGSLHCTFGEYYGQRKTWIEKIYIALFKFILWRADAVIFNSEWQKDIYQKFYNIPHKKIAVITSYTFGKMELPAEDVKKNNEIIFAGRFIPLKNLKKLVRVFKTIETDKTLVLIGDGPLFDELKNAIGGFPRIRLEHAMTREDLWNKMRDCYAFILPSLSEMNPNVAREAFNMRKPVVITQEVGFSDEVKTFFKVVHPLSDDDIKSAIEYILVPENYQMMIDKMKDYYFYESREEAINKFLRLCE